MVDLTRTQALETLGIAPDVVLTEAILKKAWRKISKKNHPDRNLENPVQAEIAFKRANAANTLLMGQLKNPNTNSQTSSSSQPFSSWHSHQALSSFEASFRIPNQIEKIQYEFVGGFDAFKNACDTTFQYATEIELTKWHNIPTNWRTYLFTCLYKNVNLKKFNPPNFLTDDEHCQLNRHIMSNHTQHSNILYREKNHFIHLEIEYSNRTSQLRCLLFEIHDLAKLLRNNSLSNATGLNLVNGKLSEDDITLLIDHILQYKDLKRFNLEPNIFNKAQTKRLNDASKTIAKRAAGKFSIFIMLENSSKRINGTSEQALREELARTINSEPSPIDITISELNLRMPNYGATVLLEELEKNNKFTKIKLPNNLFNKSQMARLNRHLENNKLKRSRNLKYCFGSYYYTIEWSSENRATTFETFTSLSSHGSLKSLLKSDRVSKISEISLEYLQLTKHHANQVLESLLKSYRLKKVETPNYFFNPYQQKQIDDLIRKNTARTKINKSHWKIWTPLSSLGIALIAGLTFKISLALIVSGLIFGIALDANRKQFLRRKGWNYISEPRTYIKESRYFSESERNALVAGVESKRWPGYFLSFGKLSTYKNYGAYAAGLHAALDGDKDFTRNVKRFRTH